MIKIRARRELKNGESGYVIERVQALTRDRLPDEYFRGRGWRCYLEKSEASGSSMLVCQIIEKRHRFSRVLRSFTFNLTEGDWLPKRLFENRIDAVRKAGDRLHKINAKHKKEAKRFLKGKKNETIRI